MYQTLSPHNRPNASDRTVVVGVLRRAPVPVAAAGGLHDGVTDLVLHDRGPVAVQPLLRGRRPLEVLLRQRVTVFGVRIWPQEHAGFVGVRRGQGAQEPRGAAATRIRAAVRDPAHVRVHVEPVEEDQRGVPSPGHGEAAAGRGRGTDRRWAAAVQRTREPDQEEEEEDQETGEAQRGLRR